MATEPYAPFFHRLCAQAEAGRVLTATDVEDAVDDDPVAKRELAALAERVRAGEDITIGEFASRLRVPPEFALALLAEFIGEMALAAQPHTVN